MSAVIVKLPERRYRPRWEEIDALIVEAFEEKNPHGLLFQLTKQALRRASNADPETECQVIANSLGFAWLALGAILSIDEKGEPR